MVPAWSPRQMRASCKVIFTNMGSTRPTGRGSETVEIAPDSCPNGHRLRPPMPCEIPLFYSTDRSRWARISLAKRLATSACSRAIRAENPV